MGNANGGSASPFAHLPVPPPLEAAPTSLARVVNGLWFTSLFLSLAAALLCILVKQWLDEYMARTRGSAKHPHQWAQRRTFYFQGLTDWNVAAIISFLPLFLHLALFLFLAGLTAFLWDLDSDIRWVMLVLVSLLLAFYAVSVFLPVWSAACPYATPLLAQLRNLGYTALVGVCILRNWALTWTTVVRRLIHHVFNSTASLSTSSHNTHIETSESNAATPYLQITLLLEQRARRPFERLLRRMTKGEKVPPGREQEDFAARLDCSSLQWLMHDVSDSDAVAVAWQSLSALLEEPESLRFAQMLIFLPRLVTYIAGDSHFVLWRTLRMDGSLDNMQLARITRSALFIAYSRAAKLRDILYIGPPSSDSVRLDMTLSPDAALIHALLHPFWREDGVVETVRRLHRLHEQTHRPLHSTVSFLLDRLVPRNSGAHEVIGLLRYCNLQQLPKTAWTRVARVLGPCIGREVNRSHQCGASCVVNALCARAWQLIADETSDSSNPGQNSAALFGAYSHVQLVIRVISAFYHSDEWGVDFSDAVWAVLTDTRYLSHGIQRDDHIRADDWARALHILARSTNKFYASFATQYNSIWARLLHGLCRSHPGAILDENIDFDEGAEFLLVAVPRALQEVTSWPCQIEIADPALLNSRLRSALTLVKSASIAICSVDLRFWRFWRHEILSFAHTMPLFALFPTHLTLKVEEHNEWVDLFVSMVQHLMVLDLQNWQNLRH